MPARDRIRKYREVGGASDLVRVEVLVPASKRDEIVNAARRLRADHRARKERLGSLIAEALDQYSARILDNIDLDRVPDERKRAAVIAGALMERGDARAFALARRLAAEAELQTG